MSGVHVRFKPSLDIRVKWGHLDNTEDQFPSFAAVRDPIGHAYNRTTHLPERRKMMQNWANYLDNIVRASVEQLAIQQYGSPEGFSFDS